MKCKFCNQLKKNLNSLRNHERLCKENPNKEKTWIQKRKEAGIEIKFDFHQSPEYKEKQRQKRLLCPPASLEQRQKASIKTKEYYSNPENRKKHSKIMKKAVLEHPESYSDKNIVGRSKHFTIDGVRFNSTWEYEVAKFLDKNNIKWIRSNIKPISYFWNDDWHLYFPDFLIEEYNCYIEVKGYETDRDRAKWSQLDKKILVIKQKEIDLIKKQNYDIISKLSSYSSIG